MASEGDSPGRAMILDAIITTLRQHDAVAPGAMLVVAVSGGCDSVALLHLLKRSRQALGIELHVASLNHGIRAEAGQGDLEFVADLAARWRLPYTVDSVDVPRLAIEWGIGIEAAARRARYAFLARVAREQGSSCVAVGHHALDQAETILMNITRGCGIRGLRGMKVLSDAPNERGIRLLRPLLHHAKDELESYCQQHNLPYRVDETNADIAYRRNYARHEILNRLARLNPEVLGAIERLAESAAVHEDFMETHFEMTVMPLLSVSAGRWQIGKEDFAALHPAMQRRLLQAAFSKLSPEPAALSHALTLDLINWSQAARAGDRRDIGGGLKMRVSYGAIGIEDGDAVAACEGYRLIPAGTDLPLTLFAPYLEHGLRICLSPAENAEGGCLSALLPASLKLRLRTRRPGDRFKPLGMGGKSRKIKRWMIDRKIPRDIRDRIPLICADGEIIAICCGATWHLAEAAAFARRDAEMVALSLS